MGQLLLQRSVLLRVIEILPRTLQFRRGYRKIRRHLLVLVELTRIHPAVFLAGLSNVAQCLADGLKLLRRDAVPIGPTGSARWTLPIWPGCAHWMNYRWWSHWRPNRPLRGKSGS